MNPDDKRREASGEPREAPPASTRPLTCQDVIGLLLDYLEEALDADTVAALERHLEDCAACRAYFKTYDRSRRLVGEVGGIEMPAELKDRLRTFLRDRLSAGRS
jgi:anti-sigma factor RsiW